MYCIRTMDQSLRWHYRWTVISATPSYRCSFPTPSSTTKLTTMPTCWTLLCTLSTGYPRTGCWLRGRERPSLTFLSLLPGLLGFTRIIYQALGHFHVLSVFLFWIRLKYFINSVNITYVLKSWNRLQVFNTKGIPKRIP